MIFACRRSLRIRACSAADDGERGDVTGDSIVYSDNRFKSTQLVIWSENSTSHMNAPPALEPDHDLWREVWLHNCMQPMQPDYLEGQTGENPGSAARLYRRKLKLK